jgi:Asp-tRNA(Asn)/Glu-tRNA(Gln) amidotransferase A subunit family amidase
VTCSIGEETGGSIHHPAKNNSLVGLAPTQELVSRDGMVGAGLNTRVGPLCRTVKDAARLLEVIAGYDPKDELTAFSIGRIPVEPYQSFASERTLNGMRIGVIREHMDKNGVQRGATPRTIDITERAIGELRQLGATIVDPGPGGALFQSCVDKYVPLYRNRVFTEQHPKLFPLDANGKPSTDQISQLVDMFYDPSLVPAGSSIRTIGRASNDGVTRYMLTRYLRERGDTNIKSIRDLIDKSKYYKDIRADAGFVDRKAALEEMNKSQTLDMASLFKSGLSLSRSYRNAWRWRTSTPWCLRRGTFRLTSWVHPWSRRWPAGQLCLGLLGQHGIPTLSVPAGFTTHVFDRVRDAAAPGGTRLAGPIPAKLPVGIMFFGRPFSEPTLLRIASAYEAATRHRVAPPDFGPVSER